MQLVLQDEPTGCGLACVAMVAGRQYDEVKKLGQRLGINARDDALYSQTAYVRQLLTEHGIRLAPTETAFASWESLPGKALLAIKWHEENGRPFWHWVVFTREQKAPVVLDPARHLAQNRRTDFSLMQPKWFIEIYDT